LGFLPTIVRRRRGCSSLPFSEDGMMIQSALMVLNTTRYAKPCCYRHLLSILSIACRQHGQLQQHCYNSAGSLYACVCNSTLALRKYNSVSFNSGAQRPLAHHKWGLHVSLFRAVDIPLSRSSTSTSSWEFVTTLDYELSIIRGHRPYQWTIWVCNRNFGYPQHPRNLD
jgi:hypothetical protein